MHSFIEAPVSKRDERASTQTMSIVQRSGPIIQEMISCKYRSVYCRERTAQEHLSITEYVAEDAVCRR